MMSVESPLNGQMDITMTGISDAEEVSIVVRWDDSEFPIDPFLGHPVHVHCGRTVQLRSDCPGSRKVNFTPFLTYCRTVSRHSIIDYCNPQITRKWSTYIGLYRFYIGFYWFYIGFYRFYIGFIVFI